MVVFTATDGTTFDDRSAWRKYEFETNYTFRNQQKQTLLKAPGKINGQPFDLSDLSDCEVLLLDQCDQVQVDNLTNCRVFIGPCSESVFVRNCTNCVFTVACKQLRTRDSTQCAFYLYSLTDPIIETSEAMSFAPFNGAYNGIERHFVDACLEPTNNHWSQVYDFNDPDRSGQNWKLLRPQEEAAPWVVDLTGIVADPAALGACVNPVARDSGFVKYTETDSSSIASFSFKTSQKEAEKAIESQGEQHASKTEATPAPPAVSAPSSNVVPPPPSTAPAIFIGDATVVHLPPPPAPATTTSGATTAPQPPPSSPPQPQVAPESDKVATIEAAEHLAPPSPAQDVASQPLEKVLPPVEQVATGSDAEPVQVTGNLLEQMLHLGPSAAPPTTPAH